jgi:hypothetical protein
MDLNTKNVSRSIYMGLLVGMLVGLGVTVNNRLGLNI